MVAGIRPHSTLAFIAVSLRHFAFALSPKYSDSVKPLVEGEAAHADDEDEQDRQQDRLRPADLHHEVAEGQDDVEVGIPDDGGIGGMLNSCGLHHNIEHLLIWSKASSPSEGKGETE